MSPHRMRKVLAILGTSVLVACLQAAAPPRAGGGTGTTADVLALARMIDRHIEGNLAKNHAVAAPRCDDSEFVRRVYLDIAGRIPRVSEVRAFLEDRRTDRRSRLVEKLLSGPHYIAHMTNVWRVLLLPQNNNQQVQFLGFQLEQWIQARLRASVPYDKMVRELITAPVDTRQAVARTTEPGVSAFIQSNEYKPENIAAATSRIFLGVKLECAQCHDHPFARWTRKQFWEYSAFFAGVNPQNSQAGIFGGATDDPKLHEITLPGSEKKVQAKFLDGTTPTFVSGTSVRATLADWMTRADNPYFARAAANRLWEHFFGIGLVDPVDDFREDNPSTHPELLDALARSLVDHGYDLRFLIRAITASQTYQRTSVQTDRSQEDLRLFARMPLKGLSPEQVFDSLATAVGYRGDATDLRARFLNTTPRGEILTKFSNPVDRKTEYQTSILQALTLMNGKFVSEATNLQRSETLAAVLDSPFMDTRQKLDTLFLATLSRKMRGSEAGRLMPYVERGGPTRDGKRALADVFWVLLNSSEFILNH